jgi:hypothetical protein
MESRTRSHINKYIGIIFIVLFLSAILSSWYKYEYTKNYDYLVETECNPDIEVCFSRDCEEDPDSCPPNMLSNYKQYYIKAYDFPNCADESCGEACTSGVIQCEEILCGESEEDECVGSKGYDFGE